MKKIYAILIFLVCSQHIFSQYRVTFNVTQNGPAKYDSIFVTGSFNNWELGADTFKLQPSGDHRSITLNLPKGNYIYLICHGNDQPSVEMVAIGKDSFRSMNITKDSTITISVRQWYDELDRFKQLLKTEKQDTTKLWILNTLGKLYSSFQRTYNKDSALWYGQQLQLLFQKIKSSSHSIKKGSHYSVTQNEVRYNIAQILTAGGNFSEALQLRLECLHDMEQAGDNDYAYWQMCDISNQYLYMKDYKEALKYCYKMRDIVRSGYVFTSEKWKDFFSGRMAENFYLDGFTRAFIGLQRWDSALYYGRQYYQLSVDVNGAYPLAVSSMSLGEIYSRLNNDQLAFSFYRNCVPFAGLEGLFNVIGKSELGIAKLFEKKNNYDSALYYAQRSWATYQEHKMKIQIDQPGANFDFIEAGEVLARLYKIHGQPDSAYKYLQLVSSTKDSVYNQENLRKAQNITFSETLREQRMEQEKIDAQQAYASRIKLYLFIAGLVVMLAIVLILYRNNKQKNKTNKLLNDKNQEIESTLSELKATQSQLIQSEKMASLGELTAGIAHEIQNPLNFVNNFSEVSTELVDEMNEEINRGNLQDAKEIANDLKQNLEKINHHGKRAGDIVKGMLQHSRSSSATKEPTDINKLADEYFRLAYHGLRAKDKLFNAILKTDFDESIGSINIIPQDIGRVILNLITNAFYVVDEKRKSRIEGYEPTVLVSTKKIHNKLEIRVTDNGNGIPQKVLDKIFQPFFTTKPTGQGTGLGLSLSYDIVKAHGGQLKVETKEGEGTEFIVQLPNI
ncbi:MAG: ATP-binding protein [Bacteroidota bacterium]